MKGMITKSTGSWYGVKTDEGDHYQCRVRGKLRLDDIKSTNPLAVGDYVYFDPENEREGIVREIVPRENYIIRKSIKNKHQGHVIAANIDQAMLVATITYPRTSPGFIDRFLVSAESFRIPQVIVFNKIDLLKGRSWDKLRAYTDLYEAVGVTCLHTSATEGQGVEAVRKVLDGKKTLMAGHSGTGKSTLINTLAPGLNLRTSEVSDFAEKGVHTTTFAEMFTLPRSTYLVDTPGIKELGLIDMEPAELSDYFPEMRHLIGQCRFHNCLHSREPGCAVKQAVEKGTIAEQRFKSYLSMLEDNDNRR